MAKQKSLSEKSTQISDYERGQRDMRYMLDGIAARAGEGGSDMSKSLVERLIDAKKALFDGEEDDWKAAAAAIDDAIERLSPAGEGMPSACSVTVQDAVVHAAYNSDEDAQTAFEIIGGSRATPPVGPVADDKWGIDTSTASPILMYDKCSVIQDEQALLVMRLLRSPVAIAVSLSDVDKLRTERDEFKRRAESIDPLDGLEWRWKAEALEAQVSTLTRALEEIRDRAGGGIRASAIAREALNTSSGEKG